MEIINNAIEIPIMIVSNNFKKPSQPLTFVIQMQNTIAANAMIIQRNKTEYYYVFKKNHLHYIL